MKNLVLIFLKILILIIKYHIQTTIKFNYFIPICIIMITNYLYLYHQNSSINLNNLKYYHFLYYYITLFFHNRILYF